MIRSTIQIKTVKASLDDETCPICHAPKKHANLKDCVVYLRNLILTLQQNDIVIRRMLGELRREK